MSTRSSPGKCWIAGTPDLGFVPLIADTRDQARYLAWQEIGEIWGPDEYLAFRAYRRPAYDGMTAEKALALWMWTPEAMEV